MRYQINAIDDNGATRVCGNGYTEFEAIAQCDMAARKYLRSRDDIDTLTIIRSPSGTVIKKVTLTNP